MTFPFLIFSHQSQVRYFLSIVVLFIFHGNILAQVKKIKEKSMVTDKDITITVEGQYKDMAKTPTRSTYTSLYKRDAHNLLLGNNCAEEVMRNYGFKYEIVPKNHDMTKSRYFFHNCFANFKLFFRNGPFWKSRMQKKVEDCRIRTGDFVY